MARVSIILSSNFLLLSFIIIGVTCKEKECLRYSLAEFHASVFEPAFLRRIEILEAAYEQGAIALEEALIGLEERKPNEEGQDIDGVKASK